MRIALIRLSCIAGGGISRVVESWARMLAGSGHEVVVVSEDAPGRRELPATPNVRSFLYRVSPGGSRWTGLKAGVRAAVETLARLHAEAPFDLVVSHTSHLSPALRRRLPKVRLLQTFHSPLVDENRLNNWKYASGIARRATYPGTWALSWLVERRALTSIDAAHTLSRYTWDRLTRMNGQICPRVPWCLVPGTYDDRILAPAGDRRSLRRRLGLEADARILLTIRRLVPRNGVDRILRCAKEVPGGDVRFLIGGTGPVKTALERGIREEGLGDRVTMLGFVPEEDLAAYYQAADAFLLPTRDLECFGLPVVEGMACGCVPLITPDGGPAEILEGFPRCVASANSDEAFSALVQDWLAGRIDVSREEMSRRAADRYSEAAVAPAVVRFAERSAFGK